MQIFKLHCQLFFLVVIILPALIDCNLFPRTHGFTNKEFDLKFDRNGNTQIDGVKNHVHTYFYTRYQGPIVIQGTKEKSLNMQNFVNTFNPLKPTKIIIHGWVSSVNQTSISGIIRAYLDTTDYNVMGIDWKSYSYRMYTSTITNLPEIGEYVGELVNFLIQDLYTSHNLIHIVGHSLGAHVAGIAGSHVQDNKIARITGLDPAYPGFTHINFHKRLDKGDAQFVDVIHTAGGVVGIADSIGHVDFYPNNGKAVQPGCSNLAIKNLICSHRRAVLYFIESIYNPNYTFMSHKCNSWKDYKNLMCHNTETIQMGEHTDLNANGKFYLITKAESPFSLT